MKARKIRRDSIGWTPSKHAHHKNLESLTYELSESDVFRAHTALDHYQHRGRFWNSGKHETMIRYFLTALVGVAQGSIAYFTNILSNYFIQNKFETVYDLLERGHTVGAFFTYTFIQLVFAMAASLFVWVEPVSAGSGIPEVKCYLNGIDLPRVGAPKTLACKVLGVICSVSAGLPVGKEGPMVHSGAVVAATLSSGKTRNDVEVRDFVSCGAAAGVCSAFSAPIGGILFALEEGASYWGPSLTWRTFFCSMIALTTLLCLNSVGSALGKVGFNKLFSFGNFVYEGGSSSFAVYELFVFVLIGAVGGLIGAIFNNTNEKITHWRIKNINYSKKRRFLEVVAVSFLVSLVSFVLPFLWVKCTTLPENPEEQEVELLSELVPFRCEKGVEYNELASLFFTEPGIAIRQLFHLHKHAFSDAALILFFLPYICLAVVTYGIAIPSGLFVPSLLSGAAFGRLIGNVLHKFGGELASSNTYALVGAAAVLGGMARMTISLTVILLEATGNEQYVLPLMLTLMTARKPGVKFLEAELRSISRHHELQAGQIMGDNVIFLRLVEQVGTVVDILQSCEHTTFPVVDTKDQNTLFGTVSRNVLCALLKHRAFGKTSDGDSVSLRADFVEIGGERFAPIAEWEVVEGSYPKYPSVKDIRIGRRDRDCLLDLRPYANTAPISVQETASVDRTYQIFRSLGLRFLPVVNKHNQIVGTITRDDIDPEGLAHTLLRRGKKKHK